MPNALARRASTLFFEAARAQLALAGFRQVKQTTIATIVGTNVAYTVTEPGTRRVVLMHAAATYGDVRFNYNAAATGSSMPVLSQRYFVVDAKKDDTINLMGATAVTTVNIMEID